MAYIRVETPFDANKYKYSIKENEKGDIKHFNAGEMHDAFNIKVNDNDNVSFITSDGYDLTSYRKNVEFIDPWDIAEEYRSSINKILLPLIVVTILVAIFTAVTSLK